MSDTLNLPRWRAYLMIGARGLSIGNFYCIQTPDRWYMVCRMNSEQFMLTAQPQPDKFQGREMSTIWTDECFTGE